jgi:hypothetical protein
MTTLFRQRIEQTLMCMVAVSIALQLVLPMVLGMEPLQGLTNSLPGGAGDVLASHAANPVGGAIVIALITIIGAFVAPQLCGMVGI